MRHIQAVGYQLQDLTLEMRRVVRHQQTRDLERSAPVNDRACSVLGRCAHARKEPYIAGVVVPHHQYIHRTVRARTDLQIVELQEVVRLRPMDKRTERKWCLLPPRGRKADNASADEGIYARTHDRPKQRLTELFFCCVRTSRFASAGMSDHAQP